MDNAIALVTAGVAVKSQSIPLGFWQGDRVHLTGTGALTQSRASGRCLDSLADLLIVSVRQRFWL
jgi:hypothetical protein